MSGTKREGRAELELLLQFVRDGDELVVTRIDRLARSIGDLQDIRTDPACQRGGVTGHRSIPNFTRMWHETLQAPRAV